MNESKSVIPAGRSTWFKAAVVGAGLVGAAGASGFGLIALFQEGAASRPAVVAGAIGVGVVASLIPFRYGLPLAVGLSALNGVLSDFGGGHALYWNEVFAALVVGRSLIVRWPSRRTLALVVGLAAIYGAYAATGSGLDAAAWGMKVLLLSAAVGWAIARLGVGRREWTAMYYALAVVTGASVILAGWQRTKSLKDLVGLGLDFGTRVRETAPGGAVRAFAGFSSATPLSYALAIAVCCWLGFMLGDGRDRRIALATVWIPPVAGYGLYLAADRTAVIGLVLGLIVLVATFRARVSLVLATVLVVAVAVFTPLVASDHARSLGSSAQARIALWKQYLSAFRPLGDGPATAGSAYAHVAPKGWLRPFQIPAGWSVSYDAVLAAGQQVGQLQTYLGSRPPLKLSARARAKPTSARVRVTLGKDVTHPSKTLLDRVVPAERDVPIVLRVPPGREPAARVWFTVRSALPNRGNPAVELWDLHITGLPKPRTPAERVWQKWFDETPAALQSDGPGLVDNLYVSWLFQYGVLGLGLCGLWLALLLRPITWRRRDSRAIGAALTGVFLVVAALAVNVWEEAPTDFLAALVFAHAFAWRQRHGSDVADPQDTSLSSSPRLSNDQSSV